MKIDYFKFLSTVFILVCFLNEAFAQNDAFVPDLDGLFLHNTNVTSSGTDDLKGFVRLSSTEVNGEYGGQRFSYYDGSYSYDISLLDGTFVDSGNFSIDLASEGIDISNLRTDRSTLDPSKPNYVYNAADDAWSIDLPSNFSLGVYNLVITKDNDSNKVYSLSFNVVTYTLNTNIFTSEDDIILSGTSSTLNGSINYTIEKYVEYNTTHRTICTSNCEITGGSASSKIFSVSDELIENYYEDQDGDSIPDSLDSDDIIPTFFENFFANIYDGDSDQDTIPNYLDEDEDNDGILTKYI